MAAPDTAVPGDSHAAKRRWSLLDEASPREGLALALLLALVACLPVLAASMPQMSDYPAHLARYRVMLDHGQSPFLAQYYGFAWKWTGNLGADLLIYPLAGLFGLEPAGRIIVTALPVLTGLGIVAVEWTLRRRIGPGALLAFAFIWSPSLLLGFLNFQLSFALALFAFALWVRLGQWRWRWAAFLPIGLVIWLCHVSGWGILGVMVFGYEWSREKSWRAFVAPWPLLLPVLPLLFGGGTKGLFTYGPNPLNYKLGIWIKAMRDGSALLDLFTPIVALLLFLFAAIRRRIDGRLGWAALALLALSLAMPRHIVGGDYADYRLIATGLLLICLAIDWRVSRLVPLLAPLLFLVRLGHTTESWQRDSREMEQVLGALDQLPQGARVASAVLVWRQDWGFNPFEHIGGYAVVRRDALVNSNFALPKVHMLSLRDRGAEFTDPSQRLLQNTGARADLANFPPMRDVEYLWYHGAVPPATMPAGAEVIFRTERSLLARLAKPPQHR